MSLWILHSHLVSVIVRCHFAVIEGPLCRIRGAKLVSPFGGLFFDARLSVRLLLSGLPVGPGFLVLCLILPAVVGPGVVLSCEHRRDRK